MIPQDANSGAPLPFPRCGAELRRVVMRRSDVHVRMRRERLPGWVDSDEEEEGVEEAPKRQRKRHAQTAPPAIHACVSHVPRRIAHRVWLDDPLLPNTTDVPIRERLRAFVWTRNPDLRTPEDASNLVALLMRLMTTCTSHYNTLESLLRYVRTAPTSSVKAFLHEHALCKETVPGVDEEYVSICYAAVATFAAL